MFWKEDSRVDVSGWTEDVVDVSFKLSGRVLPVDHAHALSQAVQSVLPWFEADRSAGIHLIHVAASGNGWMRPEETEGAELALSKRTRFSMRVQKERVDALRGLVGQTLNVDGHALAIGEGKVRPLQPIDTVLARYVLTSEAVSEEEFIESLVVEFREMGVRMSKLLCGRTHTISTPERRLFTRSLMVAGLSPEDSVRLQQRGLGPGRKLGCGLFIPHKGVGPVRDSE